MHILVHLHVKGFAPRLALKQRQKATWKSPIVRVIQRNLRTVKHIQRVDISEI